MFTGTVIFPVNVVESKPGVIAQAVALPTPGSVSKKYSAYVMFLLLFTKNGRPSEMLHFTPAVRVLTNR